MAIALFALAYYALSYPALNSIDTHLLTIGGDGFQNYWNNWWIRHAVENGKNPWFTDMLYSPGGVSLIGATLNAFNGFMTVPLQWFLNPVTSYNLMVVFAFVFGGYATFLLAREIVGSYWPSVFAGAVFTFSPYHFAHALGHMQLVSLQWLPFFFWVWIRLLRRPSYGLAVLAAVALFLNMLCDYYYTLFAVLGGGMLFVLHAVSQRRLLFFTAKETLRPLIVFTLLSLMTCGPMAWTLVALNAADPFHGVHEKDKYVNDLFMLFIPGSNWRFHELTEWYWSRHPAQEVSEGNAYLGLSVIALAVVGLVTSRRTGRASDAWSWFLIGSVFFGLSLGPLLLVLGERYPGLWMPYRLLEILVPASTMGGMPMRMSLMTNLAAAILAGLGLRFLIGRFRNPRWLLVGVGLFVFEIFPNPQALRRPEFPKCVDVLRELPPGSVAGFYNDRADALLYQTRHEKPITWGYVARVPSKIFESGARQEILASRGWYPELMAQSKATYLVEDRHLREVYDPGLRCVYEDDRYRIFTRRDSDDPAVNAIPELVLPELEVVQRRTEDGNTALDVRWAEGPGLRYFCAFSKEIARPVWIGDQRFGLKNDLVFAVSKDQKNPLFDNHGLLDAEGRATITIRSSKMITERDDVFFSLVVFHERDPNRRVFTSRAQRITLVR